MKNFFDYVFQYDISNDLIKLKIKHTKNVAKNSDEIAKHVTLDNTQLNSNQIDLAWLIGVLHDIGRFKQLSVFNSFDDNATIDHANYGSKILFENHGALIKKFINIDRYNKETKILRIAIYNHNKHSLQNNLDEEEVLFSNIIRDADVLDIFRVCSAEDVLSCYGATQQQIENSVVSDEVANCLFDRATIDYKFRKTPADNVFVHLAMIWSLKFDISKQIALKNGYYKKMQNFVFKDYKTNRLFKEMNNFNNQYLIKCV